ncbi:hypothetical protein C8R46DRAFT_1235334 [Mycena filopes]|nr:hypothetical protein C8R46DRAFT_1235334 [Mycena filopes]
MSRLRQPSCRRTACQSQQLTLLRHLFPIRSMPPNRRCGVADSIIFRLWRDSAQTMTQRLPLPPLPCSPRRSFSTTRFDLTSLVEPASTAAVSVNAPCLPLPSHSPPPPSLIVPHPHPWSQGPQKKKKKMWQIDDVTTCISSPSSPRPTSQLVSPASTNPPSDAPIPPATHLPPGLLPLPQKFYLPLLGLRAGPTTRAFGRWTKMQDARGLLPPSSVVPFIKHYQAHLKISLMSGARRRPAPALSARTSSAAASPVRVGQFLRRRTVLCLIPPFVPPSPGDLSFPRSHPLLCAALHRTTSPPSPLPGASSSSFPLLPPPCRRPACSKTAGSHVPNATPSSPYLGWCSAAIENAGCIGSQSLKFQSPSLCCSPSSYLVLGTSGNIYASPTLSPHLSHSPPLVLLHAALFAPAASHAIPVLIITPLPARPVRASNGAVSVSRVRDRESLKTTFIPPRLWNRASTPARSLLPSSTLFPDTFAASNTFGIFEPPPKVRMYLPPPNDPGL